MDFKHKVAIDLSKLTCRQAVETRDMFIDLGVIPLAHVMRPNGVWQDYYMTNIDFVGEAGNTLFFCSLNRIDEEDKDYFISLEEFEELYKEFKEKQ